MNKSHQLVKTAYRLFSLNKLFQKFFYDVAIVVIAE